jgi:hypothetical protein
MKYNIDILMDDYNKILYKYHQQLDKSLQKEKELEMYKKLFDEFQLSIEHDTSDVDDSPEENEYLSIGGATNDIIKIFKQIQEMKGAKDE